MSINTSYSQMTALQNLQSTFSYADADGSKTLSQAEFTTAAKTNPGLAAGTTAAQEFAKLDSNKDGQLSSSELTQGLNLASEVYNALLQGQELMNGSAFYSLLSGGSSSSSLYSSLLGGNSSSSGNDFANLTSSLLGGGSTSTALITALTGGNANSTALAQLFGSSNATASTLNSILSQYSTTA